MRIERERRTELLFLGLATAYAIVVVLKNSLAWYDGVVFFAIYLLYIRIAGRRPVEESDAEGPAELLLRLPTGLRRTATVGLFLFSALVILLNAQPFSEGLITTGALYHINKFLLVQWLAPIASEAPEFTVAIMFALRKRAGMALGSLLSSNLNQWTLLVGMIPWVYALSHHSLRHTIPMNAGQMHEILLTAAQSLLGIVLLAALRLSLGQVLLLFGLFLGQLLLPELGTAVSAIAAVRVARRADASVLRIYLFHCRPRLFPRPPTTIALPPAWRQSDLTFNHAGIAGEGRRGDDDENTAIAGFRLAFSMCAGWGQSRAGHYPLNQHRKRAQHSSADRALVARTVPDLI